MRETIQNQSLCPKYQYLSLKINVMLKWLHLQQKKLNTLSQLNKNFELQY